MTLTTEIKESDAIFVVLSGYIPVGSNQIRFVTCDYSAAFATAKKIVATINRKNGQKDKLQEDKMFTNMKKETEELDPPGFGDIVVDVWSNNMSYVKIVLFKINKEYSPEWNPL
jgi:hypothetical protein